MCTACGCGAGVDKSKKTRATAPEMPPAFAPPPAHPCMVLGDGVDFDFNDGARIAVPADGKTRRIVLKDGETDCIVYAADVAPGATVVSYKKFFASVVLPLDS